MSIIVDPSDPEEDSGAKGPKETKGSRISPYRYAAIIAQKPDENNLTFVVPSEQHPDAKTLKDPDADFLIGYSRKAYKTEHLFEEPVVDLYFDRVAALGRLAISNFAEGEKVQSVTINAQNGLTGSASYADIDFENSSVNFVREEGPGAITLIYDGGMDIPADGPFYAYFVAIPGSATLTSVEVLTDQYRYTKTIEGGKELTFSEKAFKSMNLDLSTATREEVAPEVYTTKYVKVSSTADLEVDAQYLLVYEGTPSVFKPVATNTDDNTFTAGTGNVQSVSISGHEISSDDLSNCEITLQQENNKYYLYVASHERYLSFSSNGLLRMETKTMESNGSVYDYAVSIGISADNGVVTFSRTSSNGTAYHLVFNGYYQASSDAANISLYKLDDNRQPQTLSFSPAEVNFDMAGSAALVKPTLSNAIGTVTYSSSNEAIATVDSNSGDVTVKKVGTVEITASAAGNSQYKPGSASYTLVITNSSSTTPVWYKAEEIEDGETYLVVSNGYVLENDGSSAGAAVDLGVSGDSFEFEADDALIWTATESSGKYRLGNNGKVLRVTTSSSSWGGGSTITFQIGTASSTESNNQWELNAQALLMISNNYFYYSTSQSKWTLNTSASDTHTGYLYGLHAGRQAQTLAFSATSVNYDIAGGAAFTAPTLSGAQTDVKYSSSNTAVATVNATSGVVTIVGTGKTVITANAEGTNTFKPATASYTIHVIDSSIAPKTYVRVTSTSNLVVGAKYLLVYESTPSVFKPILDGSKFKKTADNVQSVTISNHSITSAELADCELTLAEGYYLYVASADRYVYPLFDGSQTTTLEAESSPSHNLTVTINSDGTAKITNAASTASSFTWSTRSSYFSSTTSATATINVCLYKEDDGSNPGGGDDPQPPTPTTATYTKVSSITSGATYLIVSADAGNYNGADGTKAFTGDQEGTAATVNNAAGVITGNYTAYEFVISASGSDYTLLGPNGYVTGNANSGSRYIQVSSTAGTMSLSMASDFTGTDGQVADAFYFYYSKTSGTSTSKEVLYFNKDGAFKVGGTGRKYGVYLYKKVENP